MPIYNNYPIHSQKHTHKDKQNMEVAWPENLSTIRERMIEELMIGLELANLLPNVVAESDGGFGSAKDLASKIIKSFSNIFTLLNIVREGDDDQVSVLSQIQVEDSSPCLVAWKSEDYSPESCRPPNNTPTKKSRRGCHQRR